MGWGKASSLTLLPCPQPSKHNAHCQSLFRLPFQAPHHPDNKIAQEHSTDRANPQAKADCKASCFSPYPSVVLQALPTVSTALIPVSCLLCPLPSWAKDTLYKAQLLGLENLSLPEVLERTRHLPATNIKTCGQITTTVCCSICAKVETIKALQAEA